MTNSENVHEIVNKILDKYKSIDILVNNAGITKDNLLLRMSVNDWDEVMNVNLKGVFNCTRIIAKVMLKAAAKGCKRNKIINISSIIGIMGNAGQANYAPAKPGSSASLRLSPANWRREEITVNAVAPGYIQTDMTAQLKGRYPQRDPQ